MGEHQHCYAHHSSRLSRQSSHNYVSFPNAWGLLRWGGGGDGHLSLVMLFVGVGLNSLVDPSIHAGMLD